MADRRIYCGKWTELRIDQKRAEEDEEKIKNIVEKCRGTWGKMTILSNNH